MQTPAASPWTSEEGREFLQGRIRAFARMIFWIAAGFWVFGAVVGLLFPARDIDTRPFGLAQVFTLVLSAIFLLMWLSVRGRPLPVSVLLVVDSVGTVAACVTSDIIPLGLPVAIRPEIVSLIGLTGILLYRAAIVPSDPKRTFWIGVAAAAPLPFVTYSLYSRAPTLPIAAPPQAYVAWALAWCALAVLLSVVTSRVIYGLRREISEARRLGQYTLVEKIGEGGMGAVYRASHLMLRRPTAIKLLPPERTGEIDLARFEREVQLTSLLTSPHTVSIYDYGRTPDGIFYYAMEYLDGVDLEDLVRKDGPMPPGRVAHVLGQVCRALEEAHGVGLIHRDIKPANVLLCERPGMPDLAKVVDFGLVKSVTSPAGPGVTLDNVVLGTPHYMAPEAISSPEKVDGRSDLYALGAVAYFLLTGKVVFEDSTAMGVFSKHLREAPVPPSGRAGRPVPGKLESLVLSALAKDPDDRPESARAFREALARCDDVPAWSEAHAAAWWRERGSRLRRGSLRPAGEESRERTLVVAFGPARGAA